MRQRLWDMQITTEEQIVAAGERCKITKTYFQDDFILDQFVQTRLFYLKEAMGISLPDSEKKDSDAPFVTLQKQLNGESQSLQSVLKTGTFERNKFSFKISGNT